MQEDGFKKQVFLRLGVILSNTTLCQPSLVSNKYNNIMIPS